MNILIPIIAVSAIGLLCAVLLSVASKIFAVSQNETYIKLRESLPGANCGACGYAGCDGYASALAEGTEPRTNLCIPGSSNTAASIAKILDVEEKTVVNQLAVILCCGDSSCTSLLHEYHGIPTCSACNLLFSGDGTCTYGCLGYGDCAAVCPNNAIVVKDGLARVIPALCTGCGQCAKACPNGLIQIIPQSATVTVRCSNSDKGGATKTACTRGCIGCKKCEKVCSNDAIHVINHRAQIDQGKCTSCGQCVSVCTAGCIVTLRTPVACS